MFNISPKCNIDVANHSSIHLCDGGLGQVENDNTWGYWCFQLSPDWEVICKPGWFHLNNINEMNHSVAGLFKFISSSTKSIKTTFNYEMQFWILGKTLYSNWPMSTFSENCTTVYCLFQNITSEFRLTRFLLTPVVDGITLQSAWLLFTLSSLRWIPSNVGQLGCEWNRKCKWTVLKHLKCWLSKIDHSSHQRPKSIPDWK